MDPELDAGVEIEESDDLVGIDLESDQNTVVVGDNAETMGPNFDIDDQGRTETVYSLSDGTRLHIVQQILVDWISPRSVHVVLRGYASRRNRDGSLPGNTPWRLSLGHGLLLTTKKIGKTSPPIDFSPLSDGSRGFNPVGANLNFGAFDSELASAVTNSLTYAYSGANMVQAVGEPRDNPINNLRAEALTFVSGARRGKAYAARRGGA